MSNSSGNTESSQAKRWFIPCNYCSTSITFYEDRLSNTGKKIPYDEDNAPHECPNKAFRKGGSKNVGTSMPKTDPRRIDTSEPMFAEILRILRRIEKNTSKSSLWSDSAQDPEGGR
ncbi:MAG: hypothetical protein M3275_00350 [Thermoproteota archaeon]|nr:hypothetical protein [Thermoproteota archaeon]